MGRTRITRMDQSFIIAIAQLLRMGETPAKIEKHLNAKFPARPITTGLIRMIAEHQNKLEKEN